MGPSIFVPYGKISYFYDKLKFIIDNEPLKIVSGLNPPGVDETDSAKYLPIPGFL
jgi:hypothetical protein